MKKILSLLVALALLISMAGCSFEKPVYIDKASDLYYAMYGYDDFAYFIKDSIEIHEDNDPDGLCGKPNQYISKISWSVRKLNEDKRLWNGGSIELFKNEQDANVRLETLQYYTNKNNAMFSYKTYGPFAVNVKSNNVHAHQKGNLVFYIWASTHTDFAEKYFSEMDEILANASFEQRDVPSDEEAKDLLNKNKEAIDLRIAAEKKRFEDTLDEETNSIDNILSQLQNNNSKSAVSEIRAYIQDRFEGDYFIEKRNAWKRQLSELDQN